MKVLIFGYLGQMGSIIYDGFKTLEYDVVGIDFEECDVQFATEIKDTLEKIQPDFVVSALPYFHNFKVAQQCIHKHIPYFDLGGNVDISKQIQQESRKYNSIVLTDLGLAPGWINIEAENGCRLLENAGSNPTSVEMYVGGIPIIPTGLLDYQLTWSIDGLINEYQKDCIVRKNGEIQTVPAMSGLKNIYLDNFVFESFYTSGGISHSINLDSPNISYRTIRWPGHCGAIKNILKQKNPAEVIQSLCPNKFPNMVLMYCKVEGSNGLCYTFYRKIVDDDKYTAMQKTTGLGCCAAVYTLMAGVSKNFGTNPRTYRDIYYFRFQQVLKELGI